MQRYQAYLISLFVMLFSVQVLAEIRINEIMYNPKDSIQCSDASCEWIELYNDGNEIVNLSGWKLDGNNFDEIIILPKKYALIARKLIDSTGGQSFEYHWGNNDGVWDSLDGNYLAVKGKIILNNDPGDTIILTDNNGEIITSVTYYNRLANGNGYTLEFFNGNWYQSSITGGTPGSENSIKEIPAEGIESEENATEGPGTTILNQDSNIGIKEITPAIIKFGDNVSVKVDVYRGSTAKYAVYFYIEKDSKPITDKISEHARTKYKNYTFVYIAQLESNCNYKYEEGKYNIVIEGLERLVSQEIDITNPDSCSSEEVLTEEETIEPKFDEQEITETNINEAPKSTGNVVYESSDFKAERLALYLFSFVLILLTIYLIKRSMHGT